MTENRILVANRWMSPDGTILHSKHRHDYVQHIDTLTGNLAFVDGGTDYIRIGGDQPLIDMCVYTDDPHEKIRDAFVWGARRDSSLEYIKLKDLETGHIRNILDTQPQIIGTYVETIMNAELEYRKKIDLINRLRIRSHIRRQIPTRKSVQNNEPDRLADLLDEAADMIENMMRS